MKEGVSGISINGNGSNIKQLIYKYGPISRIEISKKLDLTPPTITSYVFDLLASGLIRECKYATDCKSLGRKRTGLEIVSDYAYVMGIDVGPYKTYVVVTDLKGNVVQQKAYPILPGDFDSALLRLSTIVNEVISLCDFEPYKLIAIGCGFPGYVSRTGDVIRFSSNYGWRNVPFKRRVEELTGYPCIVMNNARARSVSIEMFSSIQLPDAYSYVLVAKGIASPIIVGSNAVNPIFVAPGEIGHMILDREGPICKVCGNRGCLDVYSGEMAVTNRCRDVLDKTSVLKTLVDSTNDITIDDILEAQKQNDSVVCEIMKNAISYLGIAIANLINIFNPPLVLIDCYMMKNEVNKEYFLEYAEKNLYAINRADIRIEFVSFDKYRTAIGCAGAAIRKYVLLNEEI